MAQARYVDWSKVTSMALREETTAKGNRWLMLDVSAGSIVVETRYFLPVRAEALSAARGSFKAMFEAIKAAEASLTPAAPATPSVATIVASMSAEDKAALLAALMPTPTPTPKAPAPKAPARNGAAPKTAEAELADLPFD